LILSLFACQSHQVDPYGGSLRIGIFYTPTEINPLTTDSSISANLLDLIFDTLVRESAEGQINPDLAERWEISTDEKTWTFYLRKGVKFHDGSPLTAEDVKFTFDTLRSSKRSGYSNSLINVKEVRANDPYTLQIILTKPDNDLWGGLSLYGIAPKALLEKDPRYEQFNRHPIGSGPYHFVKQEGNEIVLEENAEYFGGRPYLDQIVVKVLPSQTACLSNLIAGNIDFAFLLNPEDYGALSQIPSIKIYNNWAPMFYMIVFNMKDPLFSSAKIRQALNLTTNKALILDRVLEKKGQIAEGTSAPDFKADENGEGPGYDPKKAIDLLKEEGWKADSNDFVLSKNGKKLEFTLLTMKGDEITSKISRILQQEMFEIGVKIHVLIVPFDQYIDLVSRKRKFDMAFVNLVFTPQLDNDFSFWHSSQIQTGLNYASYHNPKADALLESARFGSNTDLRKKASADLQQVLREDPPAVFLFWRKMPLAVQARFQGVPYKRMESLRDLVQVWSLKEERSN
jgi:peptide/nickel transport system substrate-binding protein